jgi:hypothetical protein
MVCPRCGAQRSGLEENCRGCSGGLTADEPRFELQARALAVNGGRLILMSIAGLILVLAFIGLLVWPGRTITTKAPPASKSLAEVLKPAQCLDFVSQTHGEVSEYSTKISGVIKNNCGRDFRYVQVSFKLFDSSGETVGIAFTNLVGLAKGETWQFQARGFTPSVHFRVDDITAH